MNEVSETAQPVVPQIGAGVSSELGRSVSVLSSRRHQTLLSFAKWEEQVP